MKTFNPDLSLLGVVINTSDMIPVISRQIREASKFNQRFIKRYMKVLINYEYLKSGGIGVRGSRNSYRLYADEDIRLVDLSMIPERDTQKRTHR